MDLSLSDRSKEYIYGAYVTALRLLAGCRRGERLGDALGEAEEYLGIVLGDGPGLRDALAAAKEVYSVAKGGSCEEELTRLEEGGYEHIRSALYAIASRELLGAQSWRTRQAILVLRTISDEPRRWERLTPRGTVITSLEELHNAASRQAAPAGLRESYYTIAPWRRIEIEYNMENAISALIRSGVVVEARRLGAYIVPAPYLEKEFIELLEESLGA